MKEYCDFKKDLAIKHTKVAIRRSELHRQVYFKGMIRAVMIR